MAENILENWDESLMKFKKVMPIDYRQMLDEMDKAKESLEKYKSNEGSPTLEYLKEYFEEIIKQKMEKIKYTLPFTIAV